MNKTARLAMFIGAALADLAGALTAPLVNVTPYMGHSIIVTAFIVIIAGGLGSLEGCCYRFGALCNRAYLCDDIHRSGHG